MHLLMKLLIFISSIFIFEIHISNAVYETGSTSNSNSNDQKEKGKAAASSTTLTEIEEEETTLSDSNLVTNLSDLKTVERFSLRDIVSPEDEENIFPRWCDLMVDDLKSIDKKNAGNHQTMDIKEYIKEISTYEFIKDILDKIKLLEEITTELYEYNKNGQRNYVFTQNFINSMENFAEFLKLEKIDSNSNDKVKAIEKLLVNRINFNKFYEILEGLQKIQILRGIWSCGTNLPQAMIAFINNFKIDLIFGQIYNYNYFSKMDERIEKYKQEINKKIEPAEKLLNKKSKAEEEYKQLEEKKEKEQKRILAKLRSFTFNKENEEEKRLKVKSLEIEKIESEMQKFENDRKLTPAAYKNLLIKYKNLNEASLELFKGLIVEIAQKIKENVPKDSIIIDDGKLFLGQKLKKIFAQIEPLIGTMHGARNQQPQRRQEEIIPDTVVNVPPGRNQNPLTVMRSSLLANDVPVDAENAGYTWLDYIEYHLLFPETWRNEESHKISMKTNYSDLRLKIRLNAGILLVAFERIKEFIEFRGKK